MAASSNEAQNDTESQKEVDNLPSESFNSHSRSNSSVSPPVWRLVFVSSKVRQSAVLNAAARSSVIFLPYKYDNTTLDSLLLQAQETLNGRKVESIAFLVHGQGSNTVLCSNDDQVILCFLFWVFITISCAINLQFFSLVHTRLTQILTEVKYLSLTHLE